MEEFLKKYSDIPNEFITDFYSIAKEEYNQMMPIIDFDTVVKWLGVQKGHLKRLLEAKFEKKGDYEIIEKRYKVSSGKTIEKKIYLTPDCFKELCMLSQTAKAKDVRKYFLSMEKLVSRYYVEIHDKTYKKLGIVSANQKPKVDVKGGVIYVIRAQNATPVSVEKELLKLGKTSDIKKRMKTYNTGNANDIDPIFVFKVDNVDSVEKCVKDFAQKYQYRNHKEVYEVNLSIIKLLCVYCDAMINGLKSFLKQETKKKMDEQFERLLKCEDGLFIVCERRKPPLLKFSIF